MSNAFTWVPMVRPKSSTQAMGSMVAMPFMSSLVSCSRVNSRSTKHMTAITNTEIMQPQRRACIPSPWVGLPLPETISTARMVRIITSMGMSMFLARGFTPLEAAWAAGSSSGALAGSSS